MLHEGQRKCLIESSRFNVVPCGRRWGKTLMGIAMAYYGAPHAPGGLARGYDVGWFAPTYKLFDEAWRLSKAFLAPVSTRVDGSQHRIEVGRAAIDFWNLSEDVGRGRGYGLVIVDEAAIAQGLQVAWESAIRGSLTDFGGSAWFFSTPKGLNFFHELYQRGLSPEYSNWTSFRAPTANNPYISPDEIEAARGELPELVFAQEYLAEFVTFGAGLVKPEMLIDGIAPDDLPTVLGVDLAISERQTADWSVIAAMSREPSTGIIYIREVERHRVGFAEVLERIEAAAARHRPRLIAVEEVQFQAAVVQELTRTTRLPVRGVRPDRDKLTRFLPMLTRYEQRKVRHDPSGVPAWFREELTAFPDGPHDDGIDALSMAWTALGNDSPITIASRRPREARNMLDRY
jgi:predicted phage terminase large subunit-like protein